MPILGDAQYPRGLPQRAPSCVVLRLASETDPGAPSPAQLIGVYNWEIGWPRRAVHATVREFGAGATRATEHDAACLIGLPANPANTYLVRHRPLAWKPVWPGFLADSICFGLIVASIDVGIPAARGVWRRRRGLCAGCGYDLRGSDGGVCPECGGVDGDSGRG